MLKQACIEQRVGGRVFLAHALLQRVIRNLPTAGLQADISCVNLFISAGASAGASRALLNMGMAVGRAMGGTKGPLRSWREAALAKILAAGDSLRLQFPREDLGFVYHMPGAAVVPDEATASECQSKWIMPASQSASF